MKSLKQSQTEAAAWFLSCALSWQANAYPRNIPVRPQTHFLHALFTFAWQMAHRQFQASIALSTIFVVARPRVGNCRRDRSRLSAFQGQQQLEGIVCARLTAGWRYWDLPALGEMALRNQGSQLFELQMVKDLFLSLPLNHVPSEISLSPLASSWQCWQSAAAATPLHCLLQPQATASCLELARQSSTAHILHTWQSSSVL